MYLELQKRLAEHLRNALRAKYEIEVENIPLEIPPDLKFGELATPIALQLARSLRKAPKIIAQEIVAALGEVEGFAGFEVAGAGYINAKFDRSCALRARHRLAQTCCMIPVEALRSAACIRCVEHTSINPNKAAHIGHLRNAILGRHLCAPAARCRAEGRCAELHRQYRSAGGRCGGGFSPPRRQIAGRSAVAA